MRNCPDCHAVIGDTAKFCDNCGYPLQPPVPASPPAVEPRSPISPPAPAGPQPRDALGACSACGFQNLPGEMFCQNCGVQLPPVASTPPPPPRPVTGSRSSQPPAAPDRCQECGSPVAPRDVFCLNCGVQIRRSSGIGEPKPASDAQAPTALDFEAPGAAPRSAAPDPIPPQVPDPIPPQAPASSPPVVQSPAPLPPWPDSPAPFVGRLIVRSSGVEIQLPSGKGEIIIGRSDPVRDIYPEVDLTPHGGDHLGVSRRHARIMAGPEGLNIEDLNSTNYSFLNHQRLQPGQLYPIKDGDEIRVGLLILDYRRS